MRKLAKGYDFFIAQANLMAKVATTFGRVLGPKGKMPNPKAGCVVPPNANLKPLVAKLQKTVRIAAKTTPMVQMAAGLEDQKEEEVSDNILTLYDQLIHHLPKERNNVRSIYLKLTMGKPQKIDDKGNIIKSVKEEAKEEKKEEKKAEPKKEEKIEEKQEPKKETQKEAKPKVKANK